MTDLNEYECEMLDTVLGSFGVPDSLTRDQLLQLFDNDEAAAYVIIQALTREGFAAEAGQPSRYELPGRLILKPKGEKFLQSGGFTQRYHLSQQTPDQASGTLAKLQQQNMCLQTEKLSLENDITTFRRTVQKNQVWIYILIGLLLVGMILGYWIGHHV